MASWKNISKDTYNATFNCSANIEADGKLYATLQYDADAVGPTSVKLRFKLNRVSGYTSYNFYDKFYILLGQSSSGKFLTLKDAYTNTNKGYPGWGAGNCYDEDEETYVTGSFTITKSYTSATFAIPALYFINNGADAAGVIDSASKAYSAATGSRDSYTSTRGTTNLSIASGSTVATNGAAPTIYITDNGTNKFTISGTLGKSGSNNAIETATLYYTTDGTNPSNSSTRIKVSLTATSAGSYSKSVTISKACTVKAYVVCEFTYNATNASESKAIKYYAKPSNPGKPALAASSFKNNRLTIKQDWGWTWALATAANTDSPITKYRVRFYINDVNTPIIDYYDGKTVRSSLVDNSTTDYAYDRNASSSLPMPMKPTAQPLKDNTRCIQPGDKVKLSVQAYTTNGAGEKLLSSIVTSDIYTVQNAGVMQIKVGDKWKEGQVYIKVGGNWKEAETVSTKVGGAWKESE